MPTTSPAKASSAVMRARAKKNCGADRLIGLPVRTSLAFMPRSSLPEQTRTKAMRSRWLGSMLAWILKTKALIVGSVAWMYAGVGLLVARGRPESAERLDQVAHAEVAQRRAEEDRRQMAFAESVEVERPAGLARQLQLLDEGLALVVRQQPGDPV